MSKSVEQQLMEVINSKRDIMNIWLEDKKLSVYVRKTYRFINGARRRTLEIGNINVKGELGKGVGSSFVEYVHSINPFEYTFRENFLNDRWLKRAVRDGWILIERSEPPCCYKEVKHG